MLILKVLVKHLHLSKTLLSFVLLLFGLFCSSEFPLHCVLDTRLLTGKPHALLTTGPHEGCSLLRRGWVLAFHFSHCCFFFLAQSSIRHGKKHDKHQTYLPPAFQPQTKAQEDYHKPGLLLCLNTYQSEGTRCCSNPLPLQKIIRKFKIEMSSNDPDH